MPGFVNMGSIKFCVVGGSSAHLGIFSSIPGLNLLDASPLHYDNQKKKKCSQTLLNVPQVQNCPQLRTCDVCCALEVTLGFRTKKETIN